MKPFKRHPLYVLCLVALCSANASALGVGNARVLSPLGTPLKALIPIEHAAGLRADEIKAGLASDADYRRMGVEHDWAQRRLQFRAVFRDGKPYIEVTTSEPVSEPYVDFVLSLRWPNGAIAREYALLLDPAGSMAAAAPAAQMSNTVAASRPAASRHSPEPSAARSPIPTGSRYTTRRGDSLWQIAERVHGSHSVGATMDAIYQANPQAFINGDRSRLQAGVTIRVPEAADIADTSATAPARTGQATSSPHSTRATSTPHGRNHGGTIVQTSVAEKAANQSAQQLAGLQQGITQVTSDQAATRAKIAALESELNGMVARYKALSAQTEALQSRLDHAMQAAQTAAAARAAADPARPVVGSSTPWWVHAIYLGIIGALGAWLGRERLAALRRRITSNRTTHHTVAASTVAEASHADPDDDLVPLTMPPQSDYEDDIFDEDQALDPTLIAGAHIAFGQLGEARSVLEDAIDAKPGDTALQLQLLDVYAQAGNHEAFEQLAAQLDSSDIDPSERREIDHLRSRLSGDDAANVTNLDAKRRKNAS